MPFAIRKQGNKFKVVNSETGDTKGTFDNEDDAKKQMAALYANVPDARKQFTEITVKSAAMELLPVEEPEDAYPGSFHAIISSPRTDRDGDTLLPDEWEQPLPDHIVINGDHDNNHILSTVGSGVPTLEADNKVHVRGTYATTDYAQDVRKLASKGPNGEAPHLRTLSCAYREKQTMKGVRRELVNASFVLVPSNTDCVVIDSKSYEMPKATPSPADMPKTKAAVADVDSQIDPSTMTPQQRAQAIHDLAVDIGADCGTFADLTADEMKWVRTQHKSASSSSAPALAVQDHYEALAKMGFEVVLKKDGNTIEAKEFSQAPEAHGDKPSDSTADPAKDAEALARAKAAVLQMETRHLVSIEGE